MGWQTPLLQFGAVAGHAFPHVPQFFASDCKLVHVPLQSVSPAVLHVIPHTPAVHVDVPPAAVGHTVPHPPQLLVFVFSLTQAPLQSVSPADVHPHLPPLHVVPEGHTLPHAPQLLLSVASGEHICAPLAPHSVSPVPQTHAPPVHAAPVGHLRPHAPQFESSVVQFVLHPPPVEPLQLR